MKRLVLTLVVCCFSGYLVSAEIKYLNGELEGEPIPLRQKITRTAKAFNSQRRKKGLEPDDELLLDLPPGNVCSCQQN